MASAEQKRQQRAAAKLAQEFELDEYIERLDQWRPATPDACLRWIESLRIPHGPRQGERFQLGDWQRDFLREVLDEDSARRRFGLTVARRNGKSVTAALLAAVYLVGPRIAQNREWRGGIVSLTLDHATEISTTLAKLGEANGLPLATQAKPAAVFGLYGSELLTLAATPRAGHGIGLDLALLDEVGLYDDNRQRAMLENMKSATVGRDGRTVAISIRGHSQLFEEFQQEAEAAPDIAYWQQHSAPPGAQLDDIEAIRAANPGLGDTVSEKALLDKARLAKNNASAAYFYRVQNLNLRGSPDKQAICAVHEYERCIVPDLPPRQGSAIVGFDPGAANSLTGFAVAWPQTWRHEVWAGCAGTPPLIERGKADNVGSLYERLADSGELLTTDGRSLDLAEFLRRSADRLQGTRVTAIVSDYFRKSEVADALDEAGLKWPQVFRAGPRDMSEDVRYWTRAILEEKPRMRKSELLANAIADSALVIDDHGNSKLSKSRSHGRIDALSASVLAISHAMRNPIRKRRARVEIVT